MANPFPGPQPYRAADRSRFFGRDAALRKLSNQVLARPATTVYGLSGAGKSSLMQAGVIPALEDSDGVRVVRVDAWPADKAPLPWLVDSIVQELDLDAPPDGEEGPLGALKRTIALAERRSERTILIYLDQLEQLFITEHPDEEMRALLSALGWLIQPRSQELRLVLSIREDYLGRLRDWTRDRADLSAHGFRVGPLSVGEMVKAMCRTAALGEPPQRWDENALRTVLLGVRAPGQRATDAAEVQTAFGQIVCRALWEESLSAGPSALDGADAESILRRYLDATVEGLGGLQEGARTLLEEHLIDDEGHRRLLTEKEARLVLPEQDAMEVLARLERAAVLHAEEHQGSRYFELGHDWLAKKVFERRATRKAEEAERARRAAEALRQREERKARRRLAFFAGTALAVAGVVGVLGLVAVQKKKEAQIAEAQAQIEKEAAIAARDQAKDAQLLVGFRDLSARGKLPWAMKLLLEVKSPAQSPRWVEMANDALQANPPQASLVGHKGPLADALWSPDGRRILTVSDDWTARVWSADGKGRPVVLEGHTGAILYAAWSADGARVVTASEDRTAIVWSADGKGRVALTGHTQPVVFASWSADGERVVTASRDKTARVYRADGGFLTALKGHAAGVSCAIFNKSGDKVITASADKTVRVWSADGEGNPRTLSDHTAAVVFVALSPDGMRFVTASRDKTARIWSADGAGPSIELKGHDGEVSYAAWSLDNKRVATASKDGTARIWSAGGEGDGKSALFVLRGSGQPVRLTDFSPDGKQLVTASEDRTARIWALPSAESSTAGSKSQPRELASASVLGGHDAAVRSARWSVRGSVVTASSDHIARVWSAERLRSTPNELLGAGHIHAAFIGARDQGVVSVSDDGAARFRRVDGAPGSFMLPDKPWIAGAALSPQGDRLALASFDNVARLVPADGSGAPIVELRGHTAEVRAALFSPNGSRVVTASEDKTARVWSADGKGFVELRGHLDWLSSAAWSPDGERVVTTSLDSTARIWKAGGGEPARVLQHGGQVHAAAWSPDGMKIATASEDGLARIWSADEPSAPPVELMHGRGVLRLAWSADSKRLATASSDALVRVWSAGALGDWRGEPTRIQASTPVLALAFSEDGQKVLAVGEDAAARALILDIDALKRALGEANTDCLPPNLRELYLDEAPSAARAKYDGCERGQDRDSVAATPPTAAPSAADARRVKLMVLPPDVGVEIDDRPAARRDGYFELTGVRGDSRRVHVWRGPVTFDWTVTIEEKGAKPAVLDLEAEIKKRAEEAEPQLTSWASAAHGHVEVW